MSCPKCGRSYIKRMSFSDETDVIIHSQKRKRIKIKSIGSQYVNMPSDVCFIAKEK